VSDANAVLDLIVGRRSVRAFLTDLVEDETIRTILSTASRAPSGTNIQPWFVHVVTGKAKARLSAAATSAVGAGDNTLEYPYLPAELKEPYLSRRRKVGYDLYEIYGIARDDYPARKAAMLRNFDFFGAPVGLFFTMDRDHALGAWLDCGMFIQNVMIAARALGLDTCPQQAWCDVGNVVHRELDIPPNQILLTGMSLGYADQDALVNSLVTEREDIAMIAHWHGGDG
jgi:nitroreductase